MFDIEAIRNLNRVSLHYCAKDKAVEPFFKAYLTSGYSFDTSINAGDAFASVSAGIKSPFALSLINSVAEKAGSTLTGVLDIQRKMTYTGSNPSNFNVVCSLFAVNSFEDDIATPIKRLQAYLLPRTDETWNSNQLFDKAIGYVSTAKNDAIHQHLENNPDSEFTGGIWELLQYGLTMVKDYCGTISLMNRPLQFSEAAKSVYLKLPGLVVPEVYIKSVSYRIPYVTYADLNNQPVIDRVDVTLNIETMRNVSSGYMTFLSKKK